MRRGHSLCRCVFASECIIQNILINKQIYAGDPTFSNDNYVLACINVQVNMHRIFLYFNSYFMKTIGIVFTSNNDVGFVIVSAHFASQIYA